MSLRLMIVEDHPLVREGLKVLLSQADIEISGEAESCAEAMAVMRSTRPDLVMVDLSLCGESGLDLLRRLPKEGVPPMLVYSMHEDWLHVRLALQAGAQGYVTKRELSDLLLEAIHAVSLGGQYISPRARRAMGESMTGIRLQGFEECSSQETAILNLLGQGMGVGEVAGSLDLSRKTVESYCGRLQVKLNLNGMKELRLLALSGPGKLAAL
ncbi:MAG: NarL family two-component response regulator [Holophagaceae bacterium]|nr:NarL family two-component response regulator [Holophagaceae bacterium]